MDVKKEAAREKKAIDDAWPLINRCAGYMAAVCVMSACLLRTEHTGQSVSMRIGRSALLAIVNTNWKGKLYDKTERQKRNNCQQALQKSRFSLFSSPKSFLEFWNYRIMDQVNSAQNDDNKARNSYLAYDFYFPLLGCCTIILSMKTSEMNVATSRSQDPFDACVSCRFFR